MASAADGAGACPPPAPTSLVFPAAAPLPLVGLGTWTQGREGEVKDAVAAALR